MRTMLGTYLAIEGTARLASHNGTANAARADRSRASVRSASGEPWRRSDDSVGVIDHMAPHGCIAIHMVGFWG